MLTFLGGVDQTEQEKMWARFDLTADYGTPANPEHFKPIHKKRGAYEFKTKHLRVFCFKDGKTVVCTHALMKSQVKDYAREEKRVLAARDAYGISQQKEVVDYEET